MTAPVNIKEAVDVEGETALVFVHYPQRRAPVVELNVSYSVLWFSLREAKRLRKQIDDAIKEMEQG